MILVISVIPLEEPETMNLCGSYIFVNIVRFFATQLMLVQRRNLKIRIFINGNFKKFLDTFPRIQKQVFTVRRYSTKQINEIYVYKFEA
jgi:hypothetical protein